MDGLFVAKQQGFVRSFVRTIVCLFKDRSLVGSFEGWLRSKVAKQEAARIVRRIVSDEGYGDNVQSSTNQTDLKWIVSKNK